MVIRAQLIKGHSFKAYVLNKAVFKNMSGAGDVVGAAEIGFQSKFHGVVLGYTGKYNFGEIGRVIFIKNSYVFKAYYA